MSYLETLMLIALGFCLAAVIAVWGAKAAWKLAVETSERRAQRSDAELKPAAEFDGEALKSEYNKLRRRYELKVEDYNTQLAEQLAELSRARNKSEEIIASHAEACRRHEARKAEIADYKKTISALETDAAERTDRVQALEEQVADSEVSSNKLSGTVSKLRQELKAATSNADELKARCTTQQSQIDELKATAASDAQTIAEHVTRIAELEVAVTGHQSELVARKCEVTTLTEELGHAHQDNEKLHTTVRQLSDDLTARTRSQEQARTDIERLAEEKSVADSQLRKLIGTENERLGCVNRLEQELKQRNQHLAGANRELGELQSVKTAVEQERDAAQLQLDARDHDIAQLKAEIADVKSDLEAREKIVVMLRKQIASHEAAAAALNEEVSALRQRTESQATDNGCNARFVDRASNETTPADANADKFGATLQPLASRIRSLQQIVSS